ncbi:MAG TPA: universal stress protein [Steroidobacteraceae bacterium]|jgi:universal stress protein E|nr:universal stress protein [Steroidobacteraceae bacterium]
MRAIRRILVAVKDPSAASPPAVVKAAQLAQALHAELQLFHAITERLYFDAYGICDKSRTEIERETRDEIIDRLETMAAHLRNDGLKVTTAAEWDYPAYEAVLRQAERWKAHLIVAEPHAGYRIAPLVLHPTDWELLRLSPVPVLLAKSAQPYRNPIVLAAVDPSHAFAKPSGLDREILAAAKAVTTALGGELHAVHAYVPLPVGLLEVDPRTAQQIENDASTLARARLQKVVRSAGVPLTRQHLVLSAPDEAIRDVAQEIGSAIVVMGAVSRSGLKRIFIGNTAERTLDSLDCDVLVVKPAGFASRVARKPRGPRPGVVGPMLPI